MKRATVCYLNIVEITLAIGGVSLMHLNDLYHYALVVDKLTTTVLLFVRYTSYKTINQFYLILSSYYI